MIKRKEMRKKSFFYNLRKKDILKNKQCYEKNNRNIRTNNFVNDGGEEVLPLTPPPPYIPISPKKRIKSTWIL